MNKLVKSSWERCKDNNIKPSMLKPQMYIGRSKIKESVKDNAAMIDSFFKSCSSLSKVLRDDAVLMLTDKNGVLISLSGSRKIINLVSKSGFEQGAILNELSLGTNAISLSMETKKEIFLKPENHYLDFLKSWHCYATPIVFENSIVGYLDISTLNASIKDEIRMIIELLPYKIAFHMTNYKVNEKCVGTKSIDVTTRQKDIANMILLGLTEKQIATKLFIATSTVKYHKSQLFEKLDVKNTTQFIKKYYELDIAASYS